MARSTALDPVVTRTGTTKISAPPPAQTTSQALDPKCRTIPLGDQVAVPEISQ
jgi:hypothetical protein